jgi:hypothetical protein
MRYARTSCAQVPFQVIPGDYDDDEALEYANRVRFVRIVCIIVCRYFIVCRNWVACTELLYVGKGPGPGVECQGGWMRSLTALQLSACLSVRLRGLPSVSCCVGGEMFDMGRCTAYTAHKINPSHVRKGAQHLLYDSLE